MSTDLMDIDAAIEEQLPAPEDTPEGDEPKEPEGEPKEGDADKDGGKEEAEPDKQAKEGDESVENADEIKDEPPAKPKKNRAQERIESLAADRARLRRENEELRQQIESREPELPPQPDPKDYPFDRNVQGSYENALAKYNQDLGKWQATVDGIKEEVKTRDQRRIQREQEEYFTKMSSEKSVYGDYNTAVRRLSHLPITPELHDALRHEENATDLFFFFGSRPDIAESVLNLKGYQQSRKLAEISLKLRNAVNQQKNKQTKAPEPPAKPPKGVSGGGGKVTDTSKMSFEDFTKMRRKQEEDRRKRMLA